MCGWLWAHDFDMAAAETRIPLLQFVVIPGVIYMLQPSAIASLDPTSTPWRAPLGPLCSLLFFPEFSLSGTLAMSLISRPTWPGLFWGQFSCSLPILPVYTTLYKNSLWKSSQGTVSTDILGSDWGPVGVILAQDSGPCPPWPSPDGSSEGPNFSVAQLACGLSGKKKPSSFQPCPAALSIDKAKMSPINRPHWAQAWLDWAPPAFYPLLSDMNDPDIWIKPPVPCWILCHWPAHGESTRHCRGYPGQGKAEKAEHRWGAGGYREQEAKASSSTGQARHSWEPWGTPPCMQMVEGRVSHS